MSTHTFFYQIKELEEIKKHLQAKLGKAFVREAMSGARVDPLVAEKFRLDVPLPVLVGDYLEKIASSQKKPQEQKLELPSVPSAKVGSCSYRLKFPEIPSHPVISNKAEEEEKHMKVSFSNVKPNDPSQDTLPSFEELSRRFEKLKESK